MEEQTSDATPGRDDGDTGGDLTAEEPTVEALQAALSEAEARAAASEDRFLRAVAELDNFRKRAARDLENTARFSLEAFAAELLQVRDSLELGLAAAGGEEAGAESLREGTEMTLRLLVQAMEKFGIVQIDPQGETFDPALHEAMAMLESDSPPNSIIEVVQKGYQLNERLLRPARVVVAKAAEEESRGTG